MNLIYLHPSRALVPSWPSDASSCLQVPIGLLPAVSKMTPHATQMLSTFGTPSRFLLHDSSPMLPVPWFILLHSPSVISFTRFLLQNCHDASSGMHHPGILCSRYRIPPPRTKISPLLQDPSSRMSLSGFPLQDYFSRLPLS
jgi:hypothetical protein